MKPVDVKDDTNIDFKKEVNDKIWGSCQNF